jgi:ubiquinone/menaquinone biosynthesis C-methylase UbiE
MIDARKQEEIEFHDRLRTGQHEQRWSSANEDRIKDDPLWSNFKYYSVERHSLMLMKRWILEYGRDASVLDYCCGNGEESVFLAKHGAKRVVGIDISPVSIENCRALAEREGVADRVEFRVMDAEALEFPDNSFDLIMEYGVLHHLDLDRAMHELARVLKPGGCMVCTETLAHNPFIRAYRRATPHLRTAWEAEHILGRSSFEVMARHFGSTERQFFHLATLAAVPLRRTPVFSPALVALRVLDRLLLSIPGLRWQAWQVVFKLSNPRKDAAGVSNT